MKMENNAQVEAGKLHRAVPGTESAIIPELKAVPSPTPAPQLPQRPVDRYVLEYWSVLSKTVAKTVATYYVNATAAEVWPDDNFYRNAPPFIDSWLCEGWARGRVLGWLNVIPDHQVYWSEADALQRLISDLAFRAERAREEVEHIEATIADTHAALALVDAQD